MTGALSPAWEAARCLGLEPPRAKPRLVAAPAAGVAPRGVSHQYAFIAAAATHYAAVALCALPAGAR